MYLDDLDLTDHVVIEPGLLQGPGGSRVYYDVETERIWMIYHPLPTLNLPPLNLPEGDLRAL